MKYINKTSYLVALLACVILSYYGIMDLAKYGGPCNGGIVVVILLPILALCGFLLFSAYAWVGDSNKEDYKMPIISSGIALLMWSFFYVIFFEDAYLGMGVLELFAMLTLFYFIRKQ